MRKFVFWGVIAIAAVLFASCEKEDLRNLNDERLGVLESLSVNDEGMLAFKNAEEFGKALDEIEAMSDDEYASWEKAKGFYSYKSRKEDVLNKIDCIENANIDDENMFAANIHDFVKNNSDVLRFVQMENGDLSIDFVVPNTILTSIMNKDGYYAIGDSIYRVGPDKIYSVHKHDIEILKVENVKMLDDLNNVQNIDYIHGVKTSRVAVGYETSGFNNNNQFDSDRSVTIRVYVSIAGISGDYRLYGNVYVYGMKKFSGYWISYKTPLSYRNVRGTAICNSTSRDFNFTDKIDIDKKHIEDEKQIYSSSTLPVYFCKTAKGETTSRGIGNKWAILNEVH